mmetsp:Transcript_33427/g.51312  ORF Transcript_33427/g.51312 Transcript_33427/m.51312 type:complete len:114 (-) Transcript_33427:399-740(-)
MQDIRLQNTPDTPPREQPTSPSQIPVSPPSIIPQESLHKKKKGPCNHKSCPIAVVRGVRNGFFYGSRLRFAHSFVMQVLFGRGSYKKRFTMSLGMAYRHGKILAIFVFFYKTV